MNVVTENFEHSDFANQLESAAAENSTGFALKLFAALCICVINMLLARFLGTERYGVFVLGLTLVQFLVLLTTFGFKGSIHKYLPLFIAEKNPLHIKKLVFLGTIIVLSSSFFIMLVLNIFSGSIGDLFGSTDLASLMLFFSVLVVLISFTTLVGSMLNGFQKGWHNAVLTNGVNKILILMIFLLYLGCFGFRIRGILYAYMLSYLITLMLMGALVYEEYKRNTRGADQGEDTSFNTKGIIHLSLTLVMTGIVSRCILQGDRIIIGLFRHKGELGIYNIAAQISFLSICVLQFFSFIFLPIASGMFSTDDWRQINSFFSSITRWCILFSVPLVAGTVIYGMTILSIFGPEYTNAYVSLVILSLCWYIYITIGPVGPLLVLTESHKYHMYNNILVASGNIALNIILIPLIGIAGAACATLISIGLGHVLKFLRVRKELSIEVNKNNIVCSLVCLTGCMILCFTVKTIIRHVAEVTIWWVILNIGLLYAAVLILFIRSGRQEDKTIKDFIKKTIQILAQTWKRRLS